MREVPEVPTTGKADVRAKGCPACRARRNSERRIRNWNRRVVTLATEIAVGTEWSIPLVDLPEDALQAVYEHVGSMGQGSFPGRAGKKHTLDSQLAWKLGELVRLLARRP